MEDQRQAEKKIDRELTGSPVRVEGYELTPYAMLTGRSGARGDETWGMGYAWLKLKPFKVKVRAPNGSTQDVSITDLSSSSANAMRLVALGAAVVSIIVLLARKIS
jgi:hypothetical protein